MSELVFGGSFALLEAVSGGLPDVDLPTFVMVAPAPAVAVLNPATASVPVHPEPTQVAVDG